MKHLKSMSHRGRGGGHRDNTLGALQFAIDAGYEWVEFDVRSVGDELVLFHDEVVDGKLISDMTVDELSSSVGYKVTLLKEALSLIQGKIKADVELKETNRVPETMGIVLEYLHCDEFIVTSFEYDALLHLYKLDLNIRYGVIMGMLESPDAFINGRVSQTVLYKLNYIKASVVVMSEHLYLRGAGDSVKETGLDLFLWSVSKSPRVKGYINDPHIVALCMDEPYWG